MIALKDNITLQTLLVLHDMTINIKYRDIFIARYDVMNMTILSSITYVTRHEKIGLMYTKRTPSHYSTYLTFIIRYTSSVNCIRFPIVCCTNNKGFTYRLYLSTELQNFKVQKSGLILCVHKPYFLMPGHIYGRINLIW